MHSEYKKIILYFLITIFIIIIFLIINQIIVSQYIYNININSYRMNLESNLRITAQGVSQYLRSIQSDLKYLSLNNDVIELNNRGKEYIKEYYNNYKDIYTNVTRINKYGVIEYTYPYNEKAINKNVLYQEHNKILFTEKRMVISKPFDAVQGYKAIAIAIPAYKNGEFDGTVSGLLDFNKIWDLFFSLLKKECTACVTYIVCNENYDIIYAPDSIINSSDGKLNKLFLFNEGKSILKKDFQFYKKELKSTSKEYYLASIYIEMEDNNWHLIALIPEESIMKSGRNIYLMENIFLFTLVFIVIIILIVFIYIYIKGLHEKHRIIKYAIDKEREKEFFKTSLDSISLSRYFFVFICNEKGIIVYSNNHYNIKNKSIENIFDPVSANTIYKYIEDIDNYNDNILIKLNMMLNNQLKTFIFNVSYRSIDNKKHFIFAGFNVDKQIKDNTNIYENIIDEFYNNKYPIVICDLNGNIIIANYKFKDKYGKLNNLFEIEESEILIKIKKSIQSLNVNIKEMQIDLSESEYTHLIVSPIFDDFMKIKYISIELK